jgi:hypothetical protein
VTRLAPPWALTAVAMEGRGDPHLQPGVHLRVLPHQILGLPVAPLLVDRNRLGNGERVPEADVLWTDARGEALTVPFDLAPASPATAWLPSDPNDPVVYAEVLVKEARRGGAGDPFELDLVRRRPGFDPPLRRLPRSGVRVDAIVSGLMGSSVVATATRSRYQVCATGMDRVQVAGAGTVLGIRVLRAGRSTKPPGRKPWRHLALPIHRGARYEGFEDAWERAEDRVLRGAPQLLGLHDDPNSPDPPSCDSASPGDDMERVKVLWTERLEPMIRAVVDDLSGPPDGLLMPPEPMAGTRVATASVQVPPLAAVLQGAMDPGAGRLLGLLEHDDDPPAEPGDIVVYSVRGAWQVFPSIDNWLALLMLAGGPDDPSQFPLPLPDWVSTGRDGTFVDLWTVAAVVAGQPAAPLPRPAVGPMADLGWVPEVPPAARRHVAIPLSGLVPAAAVALARETPGVVGLNSRLPAIFGAGVPDRAVPIVPGVLVETDTAAAANPGEGEVHDRHAPEDATDYRVAQSDWFGRWSSWSQASVGAGVRPPVPVPVIEVAYVDPPAPGGVGTLQVRCLQPRDNDLPAGAFALSTLLVEAAVGGASPATGSATAVRGPAPAGVDAPPLLVSLPVPALAPAERRELTATARWSDLGGRVSALSPPARAQAVDPRAPAPLVLPNALEYAARPDALGRSRVRVSWPATANTAYRIYFSDETTLRQRLSTLVAGGKPDAVAAASALAGAVTAPDRAAVFRAHAGLFDKTCFELLTRTPVLASSAGPRTYDHEVSASLRVLVFFKVVPVAVLRTSPLLELGGEAAFESSTLLPRGIPNSPPPPVPLLTASPDKDDPMRVVLTVSVPAGQTAPVALRLRRSRVSGADALSMPVVATATPASWPAPVTDRGATPWDASQRFAPWSTYTWRAEVQGAPEPGSTLPGLWSGASAPASWKVIPPAPGPVSPGTAVASAAGVQLRFTSPNSLDAGGEGSYTLDVYRVTPSGSGVASAAVGTYAAGAKRQPDGSYLIEDTTPGVPAGTQYLVEVCDPLGRRGPRGVVATL